MAIVLGLDPSLTSAGLAILVNGQPARLHSIGERLPASGDYGQRSDRIGRQTRLIIETLNQWATTPGHQWPHLAVIEGQAYGINLPGTSERNGLWWRLYAALRARKVPIAVIAPKTRALWATGNGDADKKAVTAAVKTWWPHARHHIRNDDIADAAALALAGAFHLDDPMPFDIKPQHHNRLRAVQWPTTPVGATR